MDELQERKESLLAQLATADAPVPLLHPNLAALYREKVTDARVRPPESRQPF